MSTLDVCIDDCRTLGDIQIRNPKVAIQVLRRLLKSIRLTYWDNDMGGGWEFEGRNLLKQFLQDCKNANYWPHVVIVTSNSVAALDMESTLKSYGYTKQIHGSWTHSK